LLERTLAPLVMHWTPLEEWLGLRLHLRAAPWNYDAGDSRPTCTVAPMQHCAKSEPPLHPTCAEGIEERKRHEPSNEAMLK
jgi:hypothetical protein